MVSLKIKITVKIIYLNNDEIAIDEATWVPLSKIMNTTKYNYLLAITINRNVLASNPILRTVSSMLYVYLISLFYSRQPVGSCVWLFCWEFLYNSVFGTAPYIHTARGVFSHTICESMFVVTLLVVNDTTPVNSETFKKGIESTNYDDRQGLGPGRSTRSLLLI